MNHLTLRGRLSRLASSAAVVFAFLFALDRPLHAQLFVSSYGNGSLDVYNYTGLATLPTTTPKSVPIGGGGAEGFGCLVTGGVPSLFVAANNATIQVVNPTTSQVLGGVTITGATQIAGMSLSPPSGSVLYAADYSSDKIWALDTATILSSITTAAVPPALPGSPYPSVSTNASHDVAVDLAGNVYNASFQAGHDRTVLTFPSTLPSPASPALSSSSTFINLAVGTTYGLADPGGLLWSNGSFWVSNFDGSGTCTNLSDSCSSIFQFASGGSLLHKILAPRGSAPLGLAEGPDGNIYVAMFNTNAVGVITVANLAGQPQVIPYPATISATSVFNASFMSTNVNSEPKYLGFTENCTAAPTAYIEVCKASSLTNPVLPNGIYPFTVTGSAYNSSNPLMVPVGACSGPIPVSVNSTGMATVTELPTPGTWVSLITAVGYTPPPLSQEMDVLIPPTPTQPANVANVYVVPGDTSTETIVTYTNYEAPNAQLKVCKIAGDTGTEGKSFTFTVTPPVGAAPFTVEAGPMGEGGYCTVVPSTFQVGTFATVTETLPVMPLIYSQPTVTVNGVPTKPRCAPALPRSLVALLPRSELAPMKWISRISWLLPCRVLAVLHPASEPQPPLS